MRDLLMAWRLPVHFAVTATTRPRRPDETPDIDYLFLSDEEFDRLEREDGLLERAVVYGQRKGVPRSQVETPLREGRDVLVRVDVQGAASLRSLFPDALLIFIAPPSIEEARRRLEDRDTEDPEQMRIRAETAEAEMAAAHDFDYIVVNETGQLEQTVRRVFEIVAAEKARRAQVA